MENKDRNGTLSYGATEANDASFASGESAIHAPPPATLAGISLDEPQTPEPLTSQERPRSKAAVFLRFARRLDVILAALMLIGAIVAIAVATRNPQKPGSNSETPVDRFGTVALPLDDFVSGKDLTISGSSNVAINGALQLNAGLALAPSLQPTGAKAGQLYYDQGTNQLAYFNGQQFVFLTDGQQGVQSLGGATGQLVLGGGLGLTGQQLTNTGVLTVQGQSGDVSFTAGPGIILNGTTLSNDGVISIAPGSANVSVSDDGNGNVTIDMVGAGTGTVTSSGGTAGTIPLFTASQNIEDSIVTQSGLTVTITGDLSVVTGGLSLSNALTVSNGGTGTNSLAGNGVLVGNGTSPVSSVAAGVSGLCLLSTAGAPAWAACPSGSGVASLNGLTGALAIANASAAGSTITIDDASTTTKGIASFNGTNFSAAGGAVNTIQDIHSGATPTFAGVNTNSITPSAALTVGVSAQTALLQGSTTTITSNGAGNNIVLNSAATIELQDNTNVTGNIAATGDIAVNGGDLTSTGALNITPGGTLTVGAATQTLTLQGGATTSFRATSGANTTVVGFTSPTANTTLNFPALAAGTYTICTTSGNCAGAAATLQSAYDNSTSPEIVLDATRGALTVRDNATPLGANLLEVQSNDGATTYLAVTSSGIAVTGTATVTGNVNSSGGALQTGGTTRIDNTGNATNIGNVTLSGAVSGGTTFTGSGNINTTGGAIQTNGTTRVDNGGNLVNIAAVTASGNATFQGGGVTIGTSSQAGSVTLNDGSSNTGTLQVAALGQNTAYILPDPGVGSATICLSTGNCAGSGGGVTTGGGTTNRVTKFTGSQTIGDSIIADDGTTVTVGGAFVVTGNGTLQGGTLSLGTTGQAGLIEFSDGSSNTGSLQVAALGQNTLYTLPDPGAGTATVCLSTGNCAGSGGGVTTSGGTASRLPVFTGTQSIGNSWLLQNSSTLELDTTRNLSLLGGNLTVTGSGTFSGDVAVNGGDLTSTGALNITPGGTLTVGVTAQQLILQGSANTQLTATDSGNTTSVVFQTPTDDVSYRFATAAAGTYDVCTTAGNCVGTGGGVTTSGGTANRLAKFSGAQTIDDSTITDDGTTVTTTVDLVIQGGAATLGTTSQTGTIVLHDGNGQTTTLQAGDSSGGLTFILPVNSGSANQCLKQSGTGNQLIWQDCDGGSGGSSATLQTAYNNSSDPEISLNSSVGGVSIRDNATPISGNLFEIQNSAGGTTYFGVNTTGASVTGSLAATGNINTSGGAIQTAGTTRIDNSGNLVNIGTVTAGTYNGQTISSTASFTGTVAIAGNTTLTGDLAANGGDITSTGALNITPGGTLTVGATGQQLVLQGNASTTLAVTGGGFTTTVGFTGVPVGNVVYNFDRAAAAGTYDICTSAGNCLNVFDNVTGSGTIGTIPVFTGNSTTLGDSLLSQSGGTVTVNGHLNLISGNQFQVNGTQISSANLSNDSNLAKLSASQTFTGNTVAFQNGTNSTNAFAIQNQGGVRILTVDTTNAEIELGVGSSLDGKLVFSNVSNNNTVTILPGTPTANRTLTLPDASGIICTSSGNCAGAGATLQTAYNFSVGGTTPKIKVDSTLGGVDIQDADTTIGGSLLTVRGSNGSGLGAAMFDVNSTGAVTVQSGANSTDAFRVLTQGGTNVFTADTTNGLITLGQSSTLSGQIVFSHSGSASTGSIIQGALTGNRTYTLPDATGTICLNSGNCASAGGGVTTSGGTANRLPVFNGAQTLTDSWLLQNGSSLELDTTRNLSLLGGNLTVTGSGTFSGDVAVNGGDVTSTGALTIASAGAGNDVTINGADQFIVQDVSQFNAQVQVDLSANDEVFITGTGTGANTRDYLIVSMTNNTSSGIQQGLFIQNAAGTGTTEAFALFDNADTDTAVTYGIQVTSAAGGITTALDVSDSDIGTALAFGANDIDGTNFDVAGGSGNITTNGTYNTNTFNANTLQFGAAGTATVSSAASQALNITSNAAATWSTSNGNLVITAQGNLNLGVGGGQNINIGTNNAQHTITIGNQGATGIQSLIIGGSGNVNNAVSIEAGNTGGINIGSGATAHTINIGSGAAAQAVTIGSTNSTSATTIQGGSGNIVLATSNGNRVQIGSATTDGATVLLTLDSYDGSLGTPSGTNGAMYYDTSTNAFRCYQSGTWIDCISASGGFVSLQNAYTNSTGGTTSEIIVDATRAALDIQDRSTANGGTIGANLFNVRATAANDSTAGSLLLGVGNTGAVTSQNSTNSANAFRILNAAGGELVGVDSTDSILRLLSNNTGALGGFTTASNDLLDIGAGNVREGGNSVTVDGYIYYLGGCDGGVASTTVYYARLNSDGSTGAWATTGTIPQATCNNAVATYNGYIYVNGGTGNSTNSRNVYYARPNSDGTISSWSTASQVMPSGQAKRRHAMVAYNGRLYIIGGGIDTSGTQSNKVHMGTINADGSVGAMTETGTDWLNSNGGDGVMATVANGYLYVRSATQVTYGKIAANGTIGTLGTVDPDSLSSSRIYGPLVAMNGYLYSIGGDSDSNTVSYSPLNSDGSIGAWTNDTNSLMPANRANCGGVVKNGYIYCVAGWSGSAETGTVFYASGARVTVGGSLDLLANSGENVAEGNTGGELTAGNTNIVGTLNVSGNANLKDGAIINNNFAVTGLTVLRSTTNSTTAFQMLNASGTSLFTIDTTNSYVYIGNPTSDTTGALLVLDTKSDAGDPANVNGAMYYSAVNARMRCYFDGKWRFCNDPQSLTLGYNISDDFVANFNTTEVGELGWVSDTSNGGAVTTRTNIAKRNGIIGLDVGTTLNVGHIAIYLNANGRELAPLSGGEEIEFAVNIPTAADATNDYNVRIGLCDVSDGNDCDDGVYFEYDRDVNGNNWRYATANTGTRTKNNSSTAVTGWHRYKMVVNSNATSIEFFIDGTSIGTITTNIPTATIQPEFAITRETGAGTTNRSLEVDYFQLRNSFTTPR